MEDDHRVWPRPGRSRNPPEDEDAPWNPELRRTVPRDSDVPQERAQPGFDEPHGAARPGSDPHGSDPRLPWEALPPSAKLYGSPRPPRKRRGRAVRRGIGAVLALTVASGLVAGAIVAALSLAGPRQETPVLTDPVAGVSIPLPAGWREHAVPPVTGFTAVARDSAGALVMTRAVTAPVPDTRRAVAELAELYSGLILQGDRVSVVADRPVRAGLYEGFGRALRAEYSDVVNRPAYLHVMLLTRAGRTVLVVGLLQPDDTARRQALDAVMASVR